MSLKTYVYEYYEDKEARHELVSSAVREYTGKDSATVLYTETGKPYVKGMDNVFLSVTTTGEIMLVVVSDSQIGVDGEYLPRMYAPHRTVEYSQLAERFFMEEESEYVKNGIGNETALRFARVWVRKEAYVKYTGKGLSDFLNFSVYDGTHFLSEVEGVPLKRLHPSFPMSEDYIFAIAGINDL